MKKIFSLLTLALMCTCLFAQGSGSTHSYTVKLYYPMSDMGQCFDMPAVAGDLNGMTQNFDMLYDWDMELNKEFLTRSFDAQEGESFKIIGESWNPENELMYYDAESQSWKTYQYVLGEEEVIVVDLSDENYRFVRCISYDVVVQVQLPALNCPEKVEIIGSFDNGTGHEMSQVNDRYEISLQFGMFDQFMFRAAGNGAVQLQVNEGGVWNNMDNLNVRDFLNNGQISLDFSDPDLYRWTPIVYLSSVANYIDFQALSESYPEIMGFTVTSTQPCTLPNGTILRGFQKQDGSEVTNSWNVKSSYTTTMPTQQWEGVESLVAGTMFRAGAGTTIELNGLTATGENKLVVYFQPNGESERGVSVSIKGGAPVEYKGSGTKIDGVTRPAYAAEFDLPADEYEAGDIIITVVVNTCNIFGIGIHGGEFVPAKVPYTGQVEIDGLIYYLNGVQSTAEVRSFNNERAWENPDLTIPEKITYEDFEYSVTSIAGDAFQYSEYSSVTLPSSVTSIGEYAFAECLHLTSIELPDGLGFIASGAFSGCQNLSSITLPSSVTSIGEYAFAECLHLTSIELPDGLESIGQNAFNNCQSLSSITIPASVTFIGEYAFAYCSNLKTITVLSENPAIIGNRAFGTNALVIYVPCGTMDDYVAAWVNYSRYLANMPGGFEYEMEGKVNDENAGIVILPQSACEEMKITAVPNPAYEFVQWSDGNTDNPRYFELTQDTVFTAVFAIQTSGECGRNLQAHWAYDAQTETLTISGEDELVYVYIPKIVGNFADWGYRDCDELLQNVVARTKHLVIEDGIGISDDGFSPFANQQQLLSIDIANSVEAADGAFMSCMNLAQIKAPAHILNMMDSQDLANYTKVLTDVTVTGGEMVDFAWLQRSYKTLKHVDLAAATNTSLTDEAFSGLYNLTSLVLPASLETIEYKALAECIRLQSITIPASVSEIDDRAFEDCRSLEQIVFSGTNLKRIGHWAFYNCHNLASIEIPEGVEEIGDAAFYGCVYAQQANIPASVEKIGDNAFALCSRLGELHVAATNPPAVAEKTFYEVSTQAPVYVPQGCYSAYKSHAVWGKLNIIGYVPSGLDNTTVDSVQKVLRNGQLFILRDGKTYNAQGVIVE